MYVAIEGVDTSGKTTQINALKARFPDAIFTKEPGATSLGDSLRSMIFSQSLCKETELFLFLADRAEHYEHVLMPNKNALIISDRSLISGIAYAKGFDDDFLMWANRIALKGTLPDVVVLLYCDADTLKQRLKNKALLDNIEQRGIDYLLETQERMLQSCSKLNLCTEYFDASKAQESLTDKIQEAITKHTLRADER